MCFIAVDIGNHAIKLGQFSALAMAVPLPETTLTLSRADGNAPELAAWLPTTDLQWIVASVHRKGADWLDRWIKQHRPADEIRMLTSSEVPLEIDVEFPDRVGIDRLCTALAGRRSIDSENREGSGTAGRLPLILIDAGSAITVDAVSAEGVFLGGAILPGMQLAAQSLAEGTDALPLVVAEEKAPAAIGRSTERAIQAGLFWGAVGGVEAIVRRIGDLLESEFDLLATGGNGKAIASHLEPPVRHLPHLTLSGIMLASTTQPQ